MSFTKNTAHLFKRFRGSMFSEWLKEIWRDKLARGAVLLFLAFVALFVLSYIWTPYDFRAQDFTAVRQGPSMSHFFGTDLIGRDMFTRVLYATRPTIILSVMTLVLGGAPLAICAGLVIFYSKRADFAVQRIGETIGGMPPLFIILILTVILRPIYDDFIYDSSALGAVFVKTGLADLGVILIVVALTGWVAPARMYRSMVIQLREAPFVERAKMLGASRTRVLFRHILPQLYPYITHVTLSMLAGVIGFEIALSFLGFGISPPYPSFGTMFSESASARLLASTPHMLLLPAAVVSLFLMSLRVLDIRATVIVRRKQSGEV